MSRSSGGPSCSIFVGNVPYDAQEDEMRDLFARVGNVTSVRVVLDRDTKQPKGYAFIDYGDSEGAQAAIEKLNNVEYNGRRLRVDGAERELHSSGPRALEDRDRGGSRSGGGGGGGGPAPPPELPPVPVQTVADRMAKLREQEEAQKARVAAADSAERAEIARLMETLTPKQVDSPPPAGRRWAWRWHRRQVIHILGEMQRLALKAPEVARALVTENMQLALALQHAQFLAGLTEEPPLPTEPAVTERARNVREQIWGAKAAPAPAPRGSAAAAAFGAAPAACSRLAQTELPADCAIVASPRDPAGRTRLGYGSL
ncbi:unnamed protein product [Prorocentrum cordatum]|uniref:RRM domain-containing protein n=1 Tax=Prorocentrum cordatum TaxID=2364126 RepID=A0ABN9WU61_9DINO|nr:unnamed protein product [Polarella glacialis]